MTESVLMKFVIPRDAAFVHQVLLLIGQHVYHLTLLESSQFLELFCGKCFWCVAVSSLAGEDGASLGKH